MISRRSFFKTLFAGITALFIRPTRKNYWWETTKSPIPDPIKSFDVGYIRGVSIIHSTCPGPGKPARRWIVGTAADDFTHYQGPDYYQICKGEQNDDHR